MDELKAIERELRARGVRDVRLCFDPAVVAWIPSDVRAGVAAFLRAYLDGKLRVIERIGDRPMLKYCDRCDGCGWYEGGPTLQTPCEVCGGTGTVPNDVRGGAPSDSVHHQGVSK